MRTRGTTSASIDRTWAVLSDVADWPSWTPTMTRVEAIDADGGAAVGARYRVEQPKLPKATYTITDWQAGRSFTWVSRSPGVTATATHQLTSMPQGGTEIVLGVEFRGPLAPVTRLFYGRLTQRYLDTERDRLVQRVEQG